MIQIRIEKVEGPFGHPVLALAVEAWQYLLTHNYVDNVVQPLSWEDDYFVAMYNSGIGEIPIGFIAIAHQKWNKTFMLRMGYITSFYRGNKVYPQLWDAVVKDAQERKVTRISSATYLNNVHVRNIAKQRGSRETMVTLEFDVPSL